MHALYTLKGSWELYNEKKTLAGQDPAYFSPEELWEFDYLVNMIHGERPHLEQLTVILAVREGMRRTIAPRPRQHFIDLVMNNIRERENQWSNLLQNMGEEENRPNESPVFPISSFFRKYK
jgi:hypothetical protein